MELGGMRLDGRAMQCVDRLVAPREAVLPVGKQWLVRLVQAVE